MLLVSWLNFVLVVHIHNMFNNLTVGEWLGPSCHPPRSILRPILVLIDLRGLRSFVLHQFQSEVMEFSTRDRVPWFFLSSMKLASSPTPNMSNLSVPPPLPSMTYVEL